MGKHDSRYDEVWMCPTCRSELHAQSNLLCPSCRKSPSQEGRLFDFRSLTPHLDLGLAKTLAEMHEAIAPKYSDEPESWRVKESLRQIGRLARRGACLEIGGANGPMTARLEDFFDVVVSLDHSPAFAQILRERTQKTICIVGDGLFLPLRDSCVNFVVCTEVLEHVVVPTQLLLEIRRVLKPDGLLYLTLPHCRASLNPFRLKCENLLEPSDTHVNFFELIGIQHLVARCGFEVQQVRTLRDTRGILRHAWRYPTTLRRLLPAWGDITELLATPSPAPIPYWQEFVHKHG